MYKGFYKKTVNRMGPNNSKGYNLVASDLIIGTKTADAPLLSIVIPTYRRPELLRQSIASALGQHTSLPYEVIVVDNDQNPEFASSVNEVVLSFESAKLKLYRNRENIGMFGNWNRGVELASGEWVSILNDDDVLYPYFIEYVKPHINGMQLIATNTAFFGCRAVQNPRGYTVLKRLATPFMDYLKYKNGIKRIRASDIMFGNPVRATLGVLYNKEALLELGGFDESWSPISDYWLTSMYCLHHGGIILQRTAAAYRIEENESLKAETIAGFVKKNLQLRDRLRDDHISSSVGKRAAHSLSILTAYFQAAYYAKIFSQQSNLPQILEWSGLSNHIMPLPLYAAWAFKFSWRILCRLFWDKDEIINP